VYLTALAWYHEGMDLLVKDYLRRHSFQQLEDEHGVNARPNSTGDKYSLNYDQISAKNGDPLAEQCRGLVIRPTQFDKFIFGDGWKDAIVGELDVLAWPMNRFYNHGDPSAVEIDWADPGIRVYEKVDGTCIILYWDPLHGKWHAGTRSVPEADLPIQVGHMEIGDMTFSQLFLKALVATREELSGQKVDWEVDGPDKVIHLNKEMTYVFELVSTYNQIVVVYPEPRAYLLAVRHTATGKELPIETVRLQHVRRPKTWPIRDVVTLATFVDSANPAELEGAVVCTSQFGRLKVKNKTYVLAHKSKDTVMSSMRNALEAVILEKVDDLLPILPNEEAKDRLISVRRAFIDYCKEIDARVAAFREDAAGSRKRFAEQVMLSGDWTAPYFNLWENRAANAYEWFTAACKNNKLSSGSLDTILSKLTL
jgi:hypothetical protein